MTTTAAAAAATITSGIFIFCSFCTNISRSVNSSDLSFVEITSSTGMHGIPSYITSPSMQFCIVTAS
jgi:hypothetical protein